MFSLIYLAIRVLARLIVTGGRDDGAKDLEILVLCLDWSLILGRRHLDRTLRTYAEHYNRERPHRALALAPPVAEAADPVPVSPRDLLGGLIHEYHGRAA